MFETDKPETQIREVRSIIPYPQVKYNQFLYNNDIALIELNQPLIFNHSVGPICLPEKEIEPRQLCVTAGWGYTSPGGQFSPWCITCMKCWNPGERATYKVKKKLGTTVQWILLLKVLFQTTDETKFINTLNIYHNKFHFLLFMRCCISVFYMLFPYDTLQTEWCCDPPVEKQYSKDCIWKWAICMAHVILSSVSLKHTVKFKWQHFFGACWINVMHWIIQQQFFKIL